ncbi:MAG: hypothetical protein RL172_2729 [Bacteroidota bacterium]|jgi:ACS family hexuronate transporter-like MFS transporter
MYPTNSATIGKYRWTICGLVFFATTINYLDRQVISLLKGTLEKDFNWSESDYSNIVIAFQLSYAIGILWAGRFIDKAGTKIGYALSTLLWSIAAMGHALATSTTGFGIARAALGLTEAGNFPAAVKTIAEWFPKKERALATGIFNSGSNIGAIAAPLTVPFIAEKMGWQWAFIITGAIGFIWLIFWWLLYEVPARHAKLLKPEYEWIHSDADENEAAAADKTTVPWLQLLHYKQTWAFALGKFMTDPVWWFYLFWFPAFLKAQYGLTSTQSALPIAVVYTLATAGSIAGGWLPLYFTRRGWSVLKARKTAMLIYACCALPVIFTQILGDKNVWLAVGMVGFACAAHQAWSANMYTIVSDMFPKKAVGSVTGIGTMFGAISGILLAKTAGLLFDYYKNQGNINQGYFILFIFCSVAYLAGWFTIQVLVPKMGRVNI